MSNSVYRLAIPLLMLWLVAWIVLSWAGVQDDAFIHLRYADNFLRTHRITYDGVHSDYGASSLLYVYLLSFLRAFSTSPNLQRVVSTCAHLLLVAGLVLLCLRSIPRDSSLTRLLGLILLLILVGPSAVRWLDDGMETGLALCIVGVLCWATFRQSIRLSVTRPQYLACVALGFFSVVLRTELILICGLTFAILSWKCLFGSVEESKSNRHFNVIFSSSHFLVGGILALAFIRFKMHVFLPDTALAKSEGVMDWSGTFYLTGKTLISALSFGTGMFLLWLMTVFLLLRAGRFSIPTLLANMAFPVLFSLAALRGQQIQGVRYFVWTFFFSVLWNILELGRIPFTDQLPSRNVLAYCFMGLLLLALPFESRLLYPMLKDRARLLKQFEGEHLEMLQGKRGVAFDIGYIGYFSRADICDLAGLVNGRIKAAETTKERFASCAATQPDFMFIGIGEIDEMVHHLPLKDWKVCSQYDFKNVFQSSIHYLLVPRSTAPEVCKSIANSVPSDIAPLF